MSAVSGFMTDVRHVAGKNNLVADCLSHAQVATLSLGIDYAEMAKDQLKDSEMLALCTAETTLQLEDVTYQDSSTPLLCDVSMDRPRPLVLCSNSSFLLLGAFHNYVRGCHVMGFHGCCDLMFH